jgi:RNA polymerase sigma-70 factor (ECF subfamily)
MSNSTEPAQIAYNSADLLMRLSKQKDAAAWSLLIERYHAAMFWTARAILGDDFSAEDAVQESLLLVRDNACSFVLRPGSDNEQQARRWLLRVTANCAINLRRSRTRIWRRHINVDVTDVAAQAATQPSGQIEELRNALACLDEKHRRPLVLYYLLEYEYSDVARELRCSVSAARVRVHRSLRLLRRVFAPAMVGVLAARADACSLLAGLGVAAAEMAPATPPIDWKSTLNLLVDPRVCSVPTHRVLGGPSPMTVITGCIAVVLIISVSSWTLLRGAEGSVVAPPANPAGMVDAPRRVPVAFSELPAVLRRWLKDQGSKDGPFWLVTDSQGGQAWEVSISSHGQGSIHSFELLPRNGLRVFWSGGGRVLIHPQAIGERP